MSNQTNGEWYTAGTSLRAELQNQSKILQNQIKANTHLQEQITILKEMFLLHVEGECVLMPVRDEYWFVKKAKPDTKVGPFPTYNDAIRAREFLQDPYNWDLEYKQKVL